VYLKGLQFGTDTTSQLLREVLLRFRNLIHKIRDNRHTVIAVTILVTGRVPREGSEKQIHIRICIYIQVSIHRQAQFAKETKHAKQNTHTHTHTHGVPVA
jgi:hypothetical protein